MEPSNQSSDAVGTAAEDYLLRKPQLSSNSRSNKKSRPLEHPLLNPLIVDLIVKQLDPDFDQLKTLRLVSKVWTKATQNLWRNSCAVLTLNPDLPIFSRSRSKTGISVSTFMKEFQDPQSPFQLSEKPFSKYKLKDFTLDLDVCGGGGRRRRGRRPDSPAYKFWNTIGPLMESVHFYKCLFEESEETPFCPRVQFLVRLIPNLKDLVLTDMDFSEQEKYYKDELSSQFRDKFFDPITQFQDAEELLQHVNLRTLTIYGDLKNDMSRCQLLMLAPGLEVVKGEYQFMLTLLKTIDNVRYSFTDASKPRLLSNLKKVDLINSRALLDENFPRIISLSPNHLQRLPVWPSQVPLETLSLHLGAFNQDNNNLDTYLKSLSSTLTTFTAFRAPVGEPYSKFLNNASMTVLTELELMGTIAPNFGFLMSTPNLKKLRIDLGCFEIRKEVKDLIKKYKQVQIAERHADRYDDNYTDRYDDNDNYADRYAENWKYSKYQADMVSKVAGDLKKRILCSDLEHLEIDFEFPEKSLKLLGKWMPNLKTLKTILNVETVPVVCEIWNELKELVCLHGSKIENQCFIRPKDIVLSVFLGEPVEMKICDLRGLERFQLDAYCNECMLSDDAVYKGLLKMPGLKSVEICVKSRMSAKAEGALRKGIQFSKVVRVDHVHRGF